MSLFISWGSNSEIVGSLETGNQKYNVNYFQILTQASALFNNPNSFNNWCTRTERKHADIFQQKKFFNRRIQENNFALNNSLSLLSLE